MTKYWKDIKNYKGLYQISDCGQIRKRKQYKNKEYRLLKPSYSKGYLIISLYKNNQRQTKSIHRLLLETFVSFCPENMECRHLDGNRQNNKLSNLKWGTRSENVQDSIQHGTHFQPNNRGSKHANTQLTEIEIKKNKTFTSVESLSDTNSKAIPYLS